MKQPQSTLRRTAGEVRRYRIHMKLIPIIIVCLVILLIAIYAISALYDKYGSFTVSVMKYNTENYALTLSELPPEEDGKIVNKTSRLNYKSSNEISNITESDLPLTLDQINGDHSSKKDNYAAYTFYCTNVGTSVVSYEMQLYITSATNGMEKAIRIRLYVNGEYTNYAYTKTDGSGPEEGTTPFELGAGSRIIVSQKQIEDFKPGDYTKYTVVMWLEGTDADCTDEILDGMLKIDMQMNVLGINTDGEQSA